MNSQQARNILRRYRPGTADAVEPEMAAALELARTDPELARWFAAHVRVEAAVRAKFRDLPVPPGLKAQILSERRAFFSLRHVPRPALVAVAALVILLLTGVVALWPKPDTEGGFGSFRVRMVKTALRGYAMDLETTRVADVRAYLAGRQAHADFATPGRLPAQPMLGCAVVPWKGDRAAMICFGSGKTPDLWLFVVNARALPNPPGSATPEFRQVNKLTTASWTEGGKTYLLAGWQDEATLRKILNPAG